MFTGYNIQVLEDITYIRFTESPSYDDVVVVLNEIANNYPYEKRLYDLSSIKFDLTYVELQNLTYHGKQLFVKPNKLAAVAPDDLAYGEMHQFSVHRDDEVCQTRYFRTEPEALQWLNENI